LASAANAAQQPILLSADADPVNGATNVALADGVWRDEALHFGRIFHFFDSARVEAARDTWRSVTANPAAEPHYWKQDDRGKWIEGP
jgi:DNA polymerase-3 subunit chi